MSEKKRTAALVALSAASILLAAEIDKYESVKKKKRKIEDTPKIESISKCHITEAPNNLDYVKENLRISDEVFSKLLTLVEKDLLKLCENSEFTPTIHLSTSLNFLISEEPLKRNCLDSKSSVSYFDSCLPKVCEILYNNLKDTYLKFPESDEGWKEIANEFGAQWLFPQCVGALGAIHVEFEGDESSDLFLNHKGSYSIILLALTDAKSRFTCIDVGCNGSSDFDEALEHSELWEVIREGNLYFPVPDVVNESKALPYVVVADNHFPLHEYIMTPYADTNDFEKKIYNQRLSVAKQTVDHGFRILKSRFKALGKKICAEPENVQAMVLACCVLHNFLMTHSSSYSTIRTTCIDEIGSPISIKEPDEGAHRTRILYADYFSNEGKLH